MIRNVPTHDDFQVESAELFDLAWDLAYELLFNLRELKDWLSQTDEPELDGDDPRHQVYWDSARRRLATAMSLIQQGAEFGIKSRIAKVSPMLLLADLNRVSPDALFDTLKTIDAQDLGQGA